MHHRVREWLAFASGRTGEIVAGRLTSGNESVPGLRQTAC
ncbi:hypothetical protein BJ987_000731 [Nocardia goodfellowii]|uniref:Uncharacterized protein n=1 Tax=Nocardia goodfellowii TaxID=882446 RepID=A0ABS4Q816_9NOCA|nr:hypothetical protein [Nocardia goodfellowii]